MKKFKSLDMTYHTLVKQIEDMKKETIELNSLYNEASFKKKEAEKELKEIIELIKEEQHNNRVDIRNENKDFVKQLNTKEKQVNKLKVKLDIKEQEIHLKNKKLDNLTMRLQKFEKILDSKDRKLISKDKNLKKEEDKIEKKQDIINIKKSEFDNRYKKRKEYKKAIDKQINEVIKKDKKIKEEQRIRFDRLESKKYILDLKEKELKDKEEKILSDMKVLLSSKKHKNVKTTT